MSKKHERIKIVIYLLLTAIALALMFFGRSLIRTGDIFRVIAGIMLIL